VRKAGEVVMPKILYPPQAGERNLCLTVFCTMMMSIVSAVLIIYAIVIIYLPAKTVLDSTLQGPKMCTTLAKEGNLTGEEICLGWTSCHEWCLSVVSKKINKANPPFPMLSTTKVKLNQNIWCSDFN